MIKFLKVNLVIKKVVKLFLALTFLVSLTTGVNAANPMRIAYILHLLIFQMHGKECIGLYKEDLMNLE
jgi:hypothetical protein